MSSPTIDYAALAKQAGAISSTPAGGAVDYAALANQAGAIESTPAQAADNPPQQNYVAIAGHGPCKDWAATKLCHLPVIRGGQWSKSATWAISFCNFFTTSFSPTSRTSCIRSVRDCRTDCTKFPEEAVMTVGPMALGGEETQPLVLPTEHRGLALPSGPPEPTVAIAPSIQPTVSTIPRTFSGESASTQVLTGLDNKTLLRVARSRGIDCREGAQLKPSVADARIIKKIVDDFSPEELDEVGRRRGVSPEDWHVRVLQQYFPDMQIPAAAPKRVEKARTVSLSDLLGVVAP